MAHKKILINQGDLLDTLLYSDIQPVMEIQPWNTQWNFYMEIEEGEINDLPAVTQQNQSLSIPTLLQRHTSGRPIDEFIRPGGIYDFDPSTPVGKTFFDTYQAGIPNIATLDITERQELAKTTEAYIKAQSELIEEKKALNKRKKEEAAKKHLLQNKQQAAAAEKPKAVTFPMEQSESAPEE